MAAGRPCRSPSPFQRPADRAQWRPLRHRRIREGRAGIHAALAAGPLLGVQATLNACTPLDRHLALAFVASAKCGNGRAILWSVCCGYLKLRLALTGLENLASH